MNRFRKSHLQHGNQRARAWNYFGHLFHGRNAESESVCILGLIIIGAVRHTYPYTIRLVRKNFTLVDTNSSPRGPLKFVSKEYSKTSCAARWPPQYAPAPADRRPTCLQI